jgi:cytochrome P450
VTATITAFPIARDPRCPFDPPRVDPGRPVVDRVQLWDGSTPWLITDFATQRGMLADPRFSADPARAGYPAFSASTVATSARGRGFIGLDDPEHTRLRRMVTGDFTIKRVEAMRARIQHLVDELIDDLLGRPNPVDLVDAFALPLPSTVISDLLGVPNADHELFQECTAKIISWVSTPQDAVTANSQLVSYLEQLVEHKSREPGDDLISRLVVNQLQPGHISADELVKTIRLLLVAGHETTTNMVALSTVALLEHPAELAYLRAVADDRVAVASAVEELLRYLSIAHSGRRRVAIEDVDVAGHTIRAGEGVILANNIGNRDATEFPDPDVLDLKRAAKQHLAFGFGVHQCLGQSLARVELQIVLATLSRRIPTLRLAVPFTQLRFKNDMSVYGVHELPVNW